MEVQKINDVCIDNNQFSQLATISFDQVYKSNNCDWTLIKLKGKFAFTFEDVALYPDNNPDFSKGVSLKFLKLFETHVKDSEKLKGKYVSVIGIYNSNNRGHLNSYFASLCEVSCIKADR